MAMILDPFMSKLSKFLKQMEEESMDMQLGIPDQIEKLRETIRNIQCVLAHAERKQTESSAIELWLKQLKDVMYDADVVIDLCVIKAKERFDDISSRPSSDACYGCSLMSCFCNLFYSHDEIGSKIKDINLKLEGLAKQKTDLGLTESQIFPGTSDRISRVDPIIPCKIDPSVQLADIVGKKIEEDTEQLVKWLIKEEKDVTGVAAIVGMKGIWKSTLAKRIFNDPAIQEGFHLKLWVCISKEVKGAEVVLKCLILEAGGEHDVTQEISDLVPYLKKLVQGKKFLVVLDDVREESRAVWDDVLHATMSCGAHGSMLLVTTKDESAAIRMRATKLHWVDKKFLEEDTEQLVKWLIKEQKEVTRVAAIVGGEGIEKTTLAERIFNDSTIKKQFHLKLWVCFTNRWKQELKCLILEAGGERSVTRGIWDMVPLLKRLVQEKKFILVFDDVWKENLAVWDGVLHATMSGGAHGSMLLLTTEDERVVTSIRATKLHWVDKLSLEEDTKQLVKWMIKEEKDVTRVSAIVGMGGIGKTTLAKRIFNDPTIKKGFDLKLWVCISKEVKGAEVVLKCLIREAGGEHGAAQEKSDLVPLLMRLVQGKKFLLVLDDVWEESQADWDDVLRAPMSGGARGSRLLVTTRDERVAIGMRATKLHRVEKLAHEDGWSLLIKQVFQNETESEIQELKDIGLQLVKKCDGLPLAIKGIGDVLCIKRKTRDEWQAVLTNNDWFKDGLLEEVYQALYLSYEDLPPPLKQCFIFCSLFPKDVSHHKIDLIYMWLAEGFLQNSRDFWSLGNAYYTELQLRNLLEDDSSYYVDRKESRYKMHDLLWVLARHLGKDDNCVLLEGSNVKTKGSQKVRRLSIEGNEANTRVIKKEKGLRTLLLRGKPEIPHDDLCKAWSNLRILDLSESNISRLPDSLRDLVHLRYLDLSDSGINELPNSIGYLKYLLYMNLEHCTNLSHVPRSIINLQELRFLNTHNSRVKTIPAGLNRLSKLIHLYGFRPYKNDEEGFSSLDELAYLPELVILHLERLEEVSNVTIAKRANLRSKDKLQDLYLMYTYLSLEEQLLQPNEKKIKTEDVLNELRPPHSLERFVIEGYFGRYLPSWLNLAKDLPNLRYIVIENCACFEGFASLGDLPNLEYLRIVNAYSVVNIGEKFLCVEGRRFANTPFNKLGELHFEDMPNWKEWQWSKGQPAMRNLKKLFIKYCPHLRSLPEGLFHHATSMEYLFIGGINILKSLGNLEVQTMELVNYEIETLPEYLTMIMPQKLKIYCSERLLLKIANQAECGSDWNTFKHIPKITIRSRSSYATYQKTPFSFTTNITTSSGQI